MRTLAALASLALLPTSVLAEDVGRELNWQTPSSPNYKPLVVPSDAEYRLPPVPESLAAPESLNTGAQLFVKDIRVEGVTALDPSLIDATVAAYEGRTVTAAELQSLRVALTRLYVDRGFVSSGVLLPDQQVEDGVVTFRAVEGALTKVELVGESKVRERYVAGRVARYVKQPLNVADLQYALSYLQQDPNVQRLDARLAPGDEPGESVLRLGIDAEPRFHIGLGADNHRASSTGSERGTVFVGARNLTGYGDEFRASAAISEGANEGSAVFTMPISARNGAIQAYYSLSDADIIEDRFKALDIQSETETWGLSMSVPLIERIENRLSVSLGFESNHSETKLLGLPFSFSPGAQSGVAETAVGLFGLDWVNRGGNYVAGLRTTYRHGLDALDATIYDPDGPDAPFNPTGADAKFDLVQGQAVFIHRLNSLGFLSTLNDRAQFVFRTTAQLSQDPLLSLEKLAIGGVNTVRGYPENLLVRDNGVAATIELQVPIFGYRPEPHPLNLLLVPFTDYGRSWDEVDTDPVSETHDTDDASYIWSAGLGLLWQPLRGLDVQVYWGADIGDNFAPGDDPRDFRETDLQDDGISFAVSYIARW